MTQSPDGKGNRLAAGASQPATAASGMPHAARLEGAGSNLLHIVFFAVWVSVCALAPEFIWQGFRMVVRHDDWEAVGSAVLTGAIVAFFAEPLMERLRAMRLRLAHKHKTTTHATFAAFALAVLAVCIHEAITAFIANPYPGHDVKHTLAYAISEAFQWACIPFTVTVAWLCVHHTRWISVTTFLLAVAAIALVGYVFDWYAVDILTTVLPCSAVLIAGLMVMRKSPRSSGLSRCAVSTMLIAFLWLALAGALQSAFSLVAPKTWVIYTWGEYTIDFRFYMGWVIGLAVAPRPALHRE